MIAAKREALRARLSGETEATVRERASIQGDSIPEVLRQLVEAGLGKPYSPVVLENQHGALPELEAFGKMVNSLQKVLWQVNGSLRVSPRNPIEQKAVTDFLKETADCVETLRVVMGLLAGLKTTDIGQLRETKDSLRRGANNMRAGNNPALVAFYDRMAMWLENAGV